MNIVKRKIRRGVFETNSSSTHTITIYNRGELKYSDIPKNSQIIIDGTHEFGTEIFDEVGKLNFIVTILASILEAKYYNEIENMTFESMTKYDWFKWLAEVVQEESNTLVIYKCPKNYKGEDVKYAPFYETTYDEYSSLEYILMGNKSSIDDEKVFKRKIKEIIYDKGYVIENKENDY